MDRINNERMDGYLHYRQIHCSQCSKVYRISKNILKKNSEIMCGVYGYIGNGAKFKDIERIALLAETRGPHSFGFTYVKQGKIKTVKQHGKVSEDTEILRQLEGASVVIGHARLATAGDFKNMNNNQPIHLPNPGMEVSVVQNGNVYDYRELYEKHNYQPSTKNDTEALWMLFAKTNLTPYQVQETLPNHSVLIIRGDELIIMSKGLPMFEDNVGNGRVYCSREISETSIKLIKFIDIVNISKYVTK
jgi:glutamine phosphoribosylpyrophosphate amidotransferase